MWLLGSIPSLKDGIAGKRNIERIAYASSIEERLVLEVQRIRGVHITAPDDLRLGVETGEWSVGEHVTMLLTRPSLMYPMMYALLTGMEDPSTTSAEPEIKTPRQR